MKKVILFGFTLIVCLLSTTAICYASDFDDYIEQINSQYNIEISKNKNAEEKCDFKKFKENVDSVVESQLNFYKEEINYSIRANNSFINVRNLEKASGKYVTVTKTKVSNDDSFKVTATYDYFTGSPKNVKNFRNISYVSIYKNSDMMVFIPYANYPKISIIDSGRTGVITYSGSLNGITITVERYKFHAEFYSP